MSEAAKEVYIVTEGCYSDYRIEAVFSDRAKADEFVEFRNRYERGSDYQVEIWPVDSANRGDILYCVWVNRDGECVGQQTKVCERSRPEDYISNLNSRSGTIYAESTRGYDVALKIARDKLAEIKAKEAGV